MGDIYADDLMVVNEGRIELLQNTINTIEEVEKEIKRLKDIQDNYKTRLLEAMETYDVAKIEASGITITRKAPTTRESLDTKSIREELPDIYDSYVKITEVKGSLLIKVKEDK